MPRFMSPTPVMSFHRPMSSIQSQNILVSVNAAANDGGNGDKQSTHNWTTADAASVVILQKFVSMLSVVAGFSLATCEGVQTVVQLGKHTQTDTVSKGHTMTTATNKGIDSRCQQCKLPLG